MKPALLVVDVQERFFAPEEGAAESLEQALAYINAAIGLFRERGLPIFCIQHVNEAENLIPGADGFGLPKQLAVLPTDAHIHKTRGNAFCGTTLADELRQRGVDTLIITGFTAAGCVLSTYRGAEDVDFTPILLRSAIASESPDLIPFVERISNLISFGALRKLVEASGT